MKFEEIKKMLFAKMDEVIDSVMTNVKQESYYSEDTQYLAKQIHDIAQVIGQNGSGFNVLQTLIKKYNESMTEMDYGLAISYLLNMVSVLKPEDPLWSEDYEKHIREQMLDAVHILMRDASRKLKKSPLNNFIDDRYYALAIAELGEEDNAFVMNIEMNGEDVPCVCHMSDEEIDNYIAQQEQEEEEYEAGINALDDEERELDLMEEEYNRKLEEEALERRYSYYEYQEFERPKEHTLVYEWMNW